jgi:hypothetical protein
MLILCNFKGISKGNFSGHVWEQYGITVFSTKLEFNMVNGGSRNARAAQLLGLMDRISYSALAFIFFL